jgi:type II secretory pathway pseudopilin PulG
MRVHQRGTTLIEILIVIHLLMIVFAIVSAIIVRHR